MRCLELYCGIGGFAAAAERIGWDVVGALDINQNALRIYRAIFRHRTVVCSIENLQVADLARLEADLWWMSPPCQPFTCRGNRQDLNDERCKSLLRILDLIPQFIPRYVALENVPGFQFSRAADRLRAMLLACGYQFEEQLLCPTQWRVPNRRSRYYLMASQDQRPRFVPTDIPVRTLPDFLEPDPPSPVFLAEHIYNRFRQAIHVIDPFDQTAVANCFTSAYGRSPVRSGSYLHHDGRVRYFSPREILRLLGFPASFQIPSDVTPETAWRLVGNSLSVDVTADVVRSLIS